MPSRPNVLFLMDDQHRADLFGFAGDDVVRTPTFDWLAETGTVFESAYTPAPLCVPARQSIRTGQRPGTWDDAGFETFESGNRTLARHLGEHGYMTASAGKEHSPGRNQMQGWRKRLTPTPLKAHGIREEFLDVKDQDAFDRQKEFADWKWSTAKEIRRAGVERSRTQVADQRSVESTVEYVRQFFVGSSYDRAQPETPLFLKTSLIQPHFPYFTDEEELFEYYLNRVEPRVETPITDDRLVGYAGRVTPGADVTEREIRRATAAYYAMVERVDGLFGEVIDALRQAGEDIDEWVVVYASDHGEFLGERGLWGKGSFHEASVRVPLVVRYPERFDPATVTENVSLCDIFSTICDLADVPVPADVDSRSLVPLAAGDSSAWPDEAVAQNVGNDAVHDGIDSEDVMIRRGDLKYCYFGDDDSELLFDLAADPGETTSVHDDPAHGDAVEQFRERRRALGIGKGTWE